MREPRPLRDLVLPAIVLAFVVASSPLGARTGQDPERRVVAVSAIDESGRNVPGLVPASFRGVYRGQAVQIVAATVDTSPRRIALIVDTSQSMSTGGSIDLAWRSAEAMIETFTPAHRIALYEVRERLQRHADFSSDRDALLRALAHARQRVPDGPSALYNAVLVVSRELGTSGLADVIYLVSDGEDTASVTSDDQAVEAAAQTGLRVFVNRRPPPRQSSGTLSFSQAENWIVRISEATGGVAFRPTATPGERGLAESLLPVIGEVYRLEIVLPRAVDKRREWTLHLVDSQGEKRKDVRMIYPRLLVPSPRTSP